MSDIYIYFSKDLLKDAIKYDKTYLLKDTLKYIKNLRRTYLIKLSISMVLN